MREGESTSRRGQRERERERERERNPSRFHTVSAESDVGLDFITMHAMSYLKLKVLLQAHVVVGRIQIRIQTEVPILLRAVTWGLCSVPYHGAFS